MSPHKAFWPITSYPEIRIKILSTPEKPPFAVSAFSPKGWSRGLPGREASEEGKGGSSPGGRFLLLFLMETFTGDTTEIPDPQPGFRRGPYHDN